MGKPTRWMPGDRAYLVPGTPTAPSAAYRLPQVTIITCPPGPRIEVELPDSRRLWTDIRNVQSDPTPPSRRPTPPATPRLVLAPGEEQPTLW